MIQIQSTIHITDNSGARKMKCIKIIGKKPKKCGNIGNIICGSIVESIDNEKISRKSIKYALIVRSKKGIARKDGKLLSFSENSAILVSDNKARKTLSTRIFGSIPKELKDSISYKTLFIGCQIV